MRMRREFAHGDNIGGSHGQVPGCEVHWHWPNEGKAQIVSKCLRSVNEVAEGFGLRTNRSLRTMAPQSKPVLPVPEDARSLPR